ncbi:MAG: protein O-GlcNAcase [Actinomycetota bacterium]
MSRSFEVRGVVEGFYGTPWSHDARLEMLDFLADHDMNAYAYAPKDDAKHRGEWRVPYAADEQKLFAELVGRADEVSVRFGFAISPGLDIAYESGNDRATLLAKLGSLLDVGVAWFFLLLDDIPLQPGLAARQGELASFLLDALQTARSDATLTVCPTEYVGTHPSPYLADLGAALPAAVDVMWTGPTVCSPTITALDATRWAAALGGRPPLVWDNYPVNDGTMAHSVHLGPYRGRDPELAMVVRGVLCNPMPLARASKVALATAAAFLSQPDEYQPRREWHVALEEVGGAQCVALGTLADACADSPLAETDVLALNALVDTLDDEIDGPGWVDALDVLAETLRATRELRTTFTAESDALGVELAPWATAAAIEADAGLAAGRLLQQLRPIAVIDGARGRAAATDAARATHAAFLVLLSWASARSNEKVVFGPRFAVYPAVVQLSDGRAGLDVGLALREDANVIDRLCRLAVREYERWWGAAPSDVRVFVDGEERAIDADGYFDAEGQMTLVRSGPYATRVEIPLPFRDPRLT